MFLEHPVGVHKSESLHCHSGVSSNNYQRFLANGMAGKHEGDCHDNEGGRERPGQYQNHNHESNTHESFLFEFTETMKLTKYSSQNI